LVRAIAMLTQAMNDNKQVLITVSESQILAADWQLLVVFLRYCT